MILCLWGFSFLYLIVKGNRIRIEAPQVGKAPNFANKGERHKERESRKGEGRIC